MLDFVSNHNSVYHVDQIFFNTIKIIWFEYSLSFQPFELIKLEDQPPDQPNENLHFANDLVRQVDIFISFEVSVYVANAPLQAFIVAIVILVEIPFQFFCLFLI